MSRVRAFEPGEWPLYRGLRLRSLEDAPDAFGSTLEREEAFEESTWRERLASGCASRTDLPLLAEHEGDGAGLAWGRIEPKHPERAHLYQMWVAPEARGTGLGRALLEAVIHWARGAGVRELDLAVSRVNDPARRLYERAGFVAHGEPEPLRPGSSLQAQAMRLVLRPR